MSAVDNAWKRIRVWYEANVETPPIPGFFDWGNPAGDQEIEALQQVLGRKFPSDIRETYKLYNGDNEQWILPGGYLMELSEVVRTWRMFKEAVDQGLFNDSDAQIRPGIKQRWWNVSWVPILHNGGGDYHCVDLDPAEGGSSGQLIKFQHETGPSHVIAPSFEHFLTTFAEDLESGKYEFDMAQGAVTRRIV